MLAKLTFGECRHIRLRRDDNLLLFCTMQQSTLLTIPVLLDVLNVSFSGNRQTQRFCVMDELNISSEELWETDLPEFTRYRADLLLFCEYRDALLERGGR